MPNQFGGYSFIDVAQGKPEADKAEREARLDQIRAGTMQQQQVNEGRALDLRKRRKLAEEGGVDDKDVQKEGLIKDFEISDQAFKNTVLQPAQQGIMTSEMAGATADAKLGAFAKGFQLHQLGFKKDALKLLSDSSAVSPGVSFTDMGETEEKGPDGKPVKMFTVTAADGSVAFNQPLSVVKRGAQQFGARYVNRPDGMYRIGADGVPQKLVHTPHTAASEGQLYDVNLPPPASLGTGVSPRRALAQETHEDTRVKQGTDVVNKYFGIDSFAGLKTESQPKYMKIIDSMGRKVRDGMHPEAAAATAIGEDEREEKLKKPGAGSTQRGAGLQPADAARVIFGTQRPGYDEGGIVDYGSYDPGGEGMYSEEEKKKRKGPLPYQQYEGAGPYMIPMPAVPTVQRFAKGGVVHGPGGKDNVAAVVDGQQSVALSSGEGVLNKAAVAIVGEDFVNRLNQAALNITRPTRR